MSGSKDGGLAKTSHPQKWYHVLRISLGIVLIVAACFKAYQLATEPSLVIGEGWINELLSSRWLQIVEMEFELGFGLWIIVGLYQDLTRKVAIGLFSCFILVTLYKVIDGAASCGCFGKVQINPWYTLIFDIAVVGLLIWFEPGRRTKELTERSILPYGAVVLAIWLLVGVPFGYVAGYERVVETKDSGLTFADESFVILEPEDWEGKAFPLIPYIDIGDKLSRGDWLVVLYSHDCSHCMEELPGYIQKAKVWENDSSKPKIALVEMPPHEYAVDDKQSSKLHYGKLSDKYEWFAQTPLTVRIKDAHVETQGYSGN